VNMIGDTMLEPIEEIEGEADGKRYSCHGKQ